LFLILELLFIILLIAILFMVYRNERMSSKRALPHGMAEEYWDGNERRKHARFRKALDITYSVRPNSRYDKTGKTGDISEGGVKLLLDEKLPKGAMLDLKIPLLSASRTVNVEGEVMWSEDSPQKDISGKRLFYSGVMFRASPEPSHQFLIRYIRSVGSGEAD
jgi:hypothetical protein